MNILKTGLAILMFMGCSKAEKVSLLTENTSFRSNKHSEQPEPSKNTTTSFKMSDDQLFSLRLSAPELLEGNMTRLSHLKFNTVLQSKISKRTTNEQLKPQTHLQVFDHLGNIIFDEIREGLNNDWVVKLEEGPFVARASVTTSSDIPLHFSEKPEIPFTVDREPPLIVGHGRLAEAASLEGKKLDIALYANEPYVTCEAFTLKNALDEKDTRELNLTVKPELENQRTVFRSAIENAPSDWVFALVLYTCFDRALNRTEGALITEQKSVELEVRAKVIAPKAEPVGINLANFDLDPSSEIYFLGERTLNLEIELVTNTGQKVPESVYPSLAGQIQLFPYFQENSPIKPKPPLPLNDGTDYHKSMDWLYTWDTSKTKRKLSRNVGYPRNLGKFVQFPLPLGMPSQTVNHFGVVMTKFKVIELEERDENGNKQTINEEWWTNMDVVSFIIDEAGPSLTWSIPHDFKEYAPNETKEFTVNVSSLYGAPIVDARLEWSEDAVNWFPYTNGVTLNILPDFSKIIFNAPLPNPNKDIRLRAKAKDLVGHTDTTSISGILNGRVKNLDPTTSSDCSNKSRLQAQVAKKIVCYVANPSTGLPDRNTSPNFFIALENTSNTAPTYRSASKELGYMIRTDMGSTPISDSGLWPFIMGTEALTGNNGNFLVNKIQLTNTQLTADKAEVVFGIEPYRSNALVKLVESVTNHCYLPSTASFADITLQSQGMTSLSDILTQINNNLTAADLPKINLWERPLTTSNNYHVSAFPCD